MYIKYNKNNERRGHEVAEWEGLERGGEKWERCRIIKTN